MRFTLAWLILAVAPGAAQTDALADLGRGILDYQEGKYQSAADRLARAGERPAELADYAVYYRALALAALDNHADAANLLADFGTRFPVSPLVSDAARQRIESLSRSGRAREALALCPANPSTVGEWYLLAQVAERAGELVRAAQAYQRVYYEFPTSMAQAQALAATRTLRQRLGARYPAPSAALRLNRADRLAAAGQHRSARSEYRTLAASLRGLSREQAAVRVGASDYHLGVNTRAYTYLKTLKVSQPEAAAERLYYLAALARRLKRTDEFTSLVARLSKDYPASPWREEALFSAGNHFLLLAEPDRYVPYYREVFEAFPQGKHAANAHWKVAWAAYLDKSNPEKARRLLEEHVRLYPDSGQTTAAIYWLGRLAESRLDPITARALYAHLTANFPHYYHSLLAHERLAAMSSIPSGPVSPAVVSLTALVASSPPPAAPASADFAPFLSRARLLDRLGLADLAERELRFRADSGGSFAFHAGLELARRAAAAENYHQAIRWLKRYTPGYLAFPLDSLPREYWELLFPMPWRDEIVGYSEIRDVDPYLVAALIRQESEFNPDAVSRARARGLMQIMLPTGRRLGRDLGIRAISTRHLHQPETSLRLGILHLRKVLDQFENQLELALAGYNAGENRVDRWKEFYTTQDPAEFVESIPFTETRTYVQAVLRNARIYRELYGG